VSAGDAAERGDSVARTSASCGTFGVDDCDPCVRLACSRMYCHTYPDSAPVVSISDAPVKVAISVPDPDQVTDQDVECGRQLVGLLARYVAELEQLGSANRNTEPGQDDAAGRAA
jgi:hypothetical protein